MIARQIPFAPAAGFVQEATPPRIECKGCATRFAHRAPIRSARSCGFEPERRARRARRTRKALAGRDTNGPTTRGLSRTSSQMTVLLSAQ